MIINDVHVHISLEKTLFNSKTFQDFLKDKNKFNINNCVLFAHPLVKRLYDCLLNHTIKVLDNSDGIEYRCTQCDKVLYSGQDPFHLSNIALINMCNKHKGLFPFLYLTLGKTIEEEVNYFETNFKNQYYGIKIHPNCCQQKVDKFIFNTDKPLIIHCGKSEIDCASHALNLAKKAKGNVLLAHLARLHPSTLKEIKFHENVFLDMSPTYYLQQIADSNYQKTYESEITKYHNVHDIMMKVIEIVGEDKIIFGSDIPFGNYNDLENLQKTLALDKDLEKKVFETNFYNYLKIKLI